MRARLPLFLAFLSLRACRGSVEEGFELKFMTCNESDAGTIDRISISFCNGASTCRMGPPNMYNENGELELKNTWAAFAVPLDYEPTTMEVSKAKHDAWCIEHVYWDSGSDLLGRGSRIYLDGDLGSDGCQFGVHYNQGRQHPCNDTWRFFNLPGSDSYRYEVEVKSCKGTRHSKARAWFCAEPTCDPDLGDTEECNLTADASADWATTRVHVDFNPVSMRIFALDTFWCAEEILFNGYPLLGDAIRQVELNPGQDRHFYNVQSKGLHPPPSPPPEEDGLRVTRFLAEVVSGVIVALAVSLALGMTSCGSKSIQRLAGCQTSDRGPKGVEDGGTQHGLLDDNSSPRSVSRSASTAATAPGAATTRGFRSSTRTLLPGVQSRRGRVGPLPGLVGIRRMIPRGLSQGRLLERGGSSISLEQGRESPVRSEEERSVSDAERREVYVASQSSYEMVHLRPRVAESPSADEPPSPI